VRFGQTRTGFVVIACLGYSRAGVGSLIFSKEAPDVLRGIGRCLCALCGLPATLVWDREGALHAGGGRPSEAFATFCGMPRVGWRFCQAGDVEAKGVVERLQGGPEQEPHPVVGRLPLAHPAFESTRVAARRLYPSVEFRASRLSPLTADRIRPPARGQRRVIFAPRPGDTRPPWPGETSLSVRVNL
jgi:hypothetical protein